MIFIWKSDGDLFNPLSSWSSNQFLKDSLKLALDESDLANIAVIFYGWRKFEFEVMGYSEILHSNNISF